MPNLSIWELLIILAIVALLFGTKRLRNIGSDLGAAIKGFRSAVSGEGDSDKDKGPSAKSTEVPSADTTEDTKKDS